MIQVDKRVKSQEDMEAWFGQFNNNTFPLEKDGLMALTAPRAISCDFEEKTLELAYDVNEWQLNPEGGLHGGMIVTFLDMTFGVLCHYYAMPNMVCTVNISTNFLKPVLPNDRVHCKAKIVSIGKTMVTMTAEARLERDDILAATSSTTFMILRLTKDYPR